MRYLPTGKKMGEADRHTIDGIGISSLVLMERAALQCLHVIEARQIDTGNVLIWTAAAGGSLAVCIAAARKKQRI